MPLSIWVEGVKGPHKRVSHLVKKRSRACSHMKPSKGQVERPVFERRNRIFTYRIRVSAVNLTSVATLMTERYRSTPELVAEVVREAILRGLLKGGDQLRQDEVAAQLGVRVNF